MDMWNWLIDCYEEGSLTIHDLNMVMESEQHAKCLWLDWSYEGGNAAGPIQKEVGKFLKYIEKREKSEDASRKKFWKHITLNQITKGFKK